jgi:AAA domain
MSKFNQATRKRVFLKLGITGPTGSVKTFSANLMAAGLADGGKVAVLDTENKSASLYADLFKFDVLDISPPFTESKFIDGINAAVSEGYAVLILDSFSHSWQGILDYKATLDARGGNSYVNWNKAGAKFNEVLAAILQSKIHIIACMRSKMDYILEPDVRGKMVPRKVGLAPIMRDGIEYEFTTVFDGDLEHFVTVSKDRTGLFVDQRFQITEETGRKLLEWLSSASEMVADTPPVPSPAPATEEALSIQQQFANALADIDPKQIIAFLIDRKQIADDQEITDVPAEYARAALERITEFKAAIMEFDFIPF